MVQEQHIAKLVEQQQHITEWLKNNRQSKQFNTQQNHFHNKTVELSQI